MRASSLQPCLPPSGSEHKLAIHELYHVETGEAVRNDCTLLNHKCCHSILMRLARRSQTERENQRLAENYLS